MCTSGIEDPEFRIDCLNAARYVLPHILCLSTSSPFWAAARRDCTPTGESSSRTSAKWRAADFLEQRGLPGLVDTLCGRKAFPTPLVGRRPHYSYARRVALQSAGRRAIMRPDRAPVATKCFSSAQAYPQDPGSPRCSRNPRPTPLSRKFLKTMLRRSAVPLAAAQNGELVDRQRMWGSTYLAAFRQSIRNFGIFDPRCAHACRR